MDFDIAEALGEGDEPVLVEALIVEHQHVVREPRGFDGIDGRRIEPGEVAPRHLANKALGQTANFDSHDDPHLPGCHYSRTRSLLGACPVCLATPYPRS